MPRAAVVAMVGAVWALAGCAGAGSPGGGSTGAVVALRVATPVQEPIWSDHARALIALTGDGRIAKIDPSTPGRTTLSAPFPDAGEDVVTGGSPATVFLPQPALGHVTLIDDADLRPVGTMAAGPSPAYLAVNSGSDHLLALSEDRSTVTPVDLHDGKITPAQDLHAKPDAELDGAKRGRRIDYYVAGSGGIAHFKGSPGAVRKDGEIGISAEQTAGDLTKPSRLYIAERGTDRLLAVDSARTGDGLVMVAQAHLGEPVRYVGVDETRIYAATEHTLTVLQTNSFEGFPDQTFPIVTTIDFRNALQDRALASAPLSGLAVGPDRVYLALQGQPYLVSIVKPSL